MQPELYFNGEKVSEEEFERLTDEANEAMASYEREIAAKFGVSDQTASAIAYLRSRSRWTEEKEFELIQMDKAGNPIPLSTVLSGEF